jgi:hypothetical protein
MEIQQFSINMTIFGSVENIRRIIISHEIIVSGAKKFGVLGSKNLASCWTLSFPFPLSPSFTKSRLLEERGSIIFFFFLFLFFLVLGTHSIPSLSTFSQKVTLSISLLGNKWLGPSQFEPST